MNLLRKAVFMSDTDSARSLQSLQEKLGFNPSSKRPTAEVFSSALDKIKAKRKEELEAMAVQALEKAIDVAKKLDTLKREFAAEEKKMTKELNKAINSINAMSEGRTVVDTEGSEDSASTEE